MLFGTACDPEEAIALALDVNDKQFLIKPTTALRYFTLSTNPSQAISVLLIECSLDSRHVKRLIVFRLNNSNSLDISYSFAMR